MPVTTKPGIFYNLITLYLLVIQDGHQGGKKLTGDCHRFLIKCQESPVCQAVLIHYRIVRTHLEPLSWGLFNSIQIDNNNWFNIL